MPAPLPREAQIEQAIVKEAENAGWLVRKVQYLGRSGAPDRWFFHRKRQGCPVLIEFKRPGGPVRSSQKREIEKLKAAGIEVHIVDSIERAREVLGLE